MTESDYLAEVYGLCKEAGVSCHHCNDSRRCKGGKGWLDLTLVGTKGVLFREVKTINDRVKPEQTAMIWLLKAAGASAKVWTEADLIMGVVAQEIAGIS